MSKKNEPTKDAYNYRPADPIQEGIYNCGNCRRQGNNGNDCPVPWNKRRTHRPMTCNLHKLDIDKLD